MRRRDFMALLGGGVVARPRVAIVQSADHPRRLGVLFPWDPRPGDGKVAEELAQLGWKEDSNLHIDYRWAAPESARLRTAASDLVAGMPDAVFTITVPALRALRDATSAIPIVFMGVVDPVGQGFVSSLAHPGGNITGFTNFEFSIGSKWLDLIKQMVPQATRAGLLFNPETAPYTSLFLPAMTSAARSLDFGFEQYPVHDEGEIERAMLSIAREPGGSLVVGSDIFAFNNVVLIVALAAKLHLPAVYPWKEAVDAGGLISYGVNSDDVRRRALAYVDRILKGENPGRLPVQQPNKFELTLNLKTARELGVTVPQALVLAADKVWE